MGKINKNIKIYKLDESGQKYLQIQRKCTKMAFI